LAVELPTIGEVEDEGCEPCGGWFAHGAGLLSGGLGGESIVNIVGAATSVPVCLASGWPVFVGADAGGALTDGLSCACTEGEEVESCEPVLDNCGNPIEARSSLANSPAVDCLSPLSFERAFWMARLKPSGTSVMNS
jgi:hypothetical protein